MAAVGAAKHDGRGRCLARPACADIDGRPSWTTSRESDGITRTQFDHVGRMWSSFEVHMHRPRVAISLGAPGAGFTTERDEVVGRT